ncbi:hypothetical protein ACA758_01875 [Mycoplasmopsis agassizii]|uniref:hypothetical protein n=1 Tax=Mycoplasmopsis agassizii TaxID=33922 RepID=UPI003526D631
MFLINRKLKLKLIIWSFLPVLSMGFFVSCASAAKNNEDQNNYIKLDNKKIVYFTYDHLLTSKKNPVLDDLDPVLIENFQSLKSLLNSWYTNQTSNKEKAEKMMEDIISQYKDNWFKENILVIDYNKKVLSDSEKENSFHKSQTFINFLNDIKIRENRITINYEKKEIYNSKNATQNYTVFYNMSRSDFYLNNKLNYVIDKVYEDKFSSKKVLDRKYNPSAFLSQAIHKFDESNFFNWNIYDKKYGLKIIKTINEFQKIFNKFKEEYIKKYSVDFSKEILDKVTTKFDSSFFKDNFLLLVSLDEWKISTDIFTSSDNPLVYSYDLNTQKSNIIFTTFEFLRKTLNTLYTRPDILQYSDYINLNNSTITNADQHTLFFSFKKSEFNLDNLSTTLEIKGF